MRHNTARARWERSSVQVIICPRQAGKAHAWRRMQDSLQQHDHSADAFLYMAQFFQEPQPAPYTELELAGQRVVQQAELYDRSLPHYFHEGDPWEAIPHPHCMAASRTHYEELIEQQSNQLRVDPRDIRREARRYSTSRSYEQWLRENPPA